MSELNSSPLFVCGGEQYSVFEIILVYCSDPIIYEKTNLFIYLFIYYDCSVRVT